MSIRQRKPVQHRPNRAPEKRKSPYDGCVEQLASWIRRELNHVAPGQFAELLSASEKGDIVALCKWPIPYPWATAHACYLARQLQALYQKRKDLDLGIPKAEVAIQKFVDSETRCRETNALFRARARGGFFFLPRVESVLFRAQQKIAHALGVVPEYCDVEPRFGPGATTLTQKKNSHPLNKLEAGLSSSGGLAATWQCANFSDHFPAWADALQSSGTGVGIPWEVSPGRVTTVPKTFETDRTIVVEPPVNNLWQMAYGTALTQRLGRLGIDLTDQSANQRAAKVGSVTGRLATIDLSSASDTVARALVMDLLPYDWFQRLDELRSQEVLLDGEVLIRLEKFSSMGNGFTFPLETLIFYALAWACSESVDPASCAEVLTYGDDIIVRTDVYPLMVEVLTACGFEVNTKKSFASGPFRESCGADYLRGCDIRPVYLRDRPNRERLYTLHNAFALRGEVELASICLGFIPSKERAWGPKGLGDSVLVDVDFTPVREPSDRGLELYAVEAYVTPVVWMKARRDSPFLYTYALYKAAQGKAPVGMTWRPYLKGTGLPYGQISDDPPYKYSKRGELLLAVPGANRAVRQRIYYLA